MDGIVNFGLAVALVIVLVCCGVKCVQEEREYRAQMLAAGYHEACEQVPDTCFMTVIINDFPHQLPYSCTSTRCKWVK